MPYTYLLFRAKRPVQTGAMVDEPDAAPIGSTEDIKALFHAVLPGLTWDQEGRHGYYREGDEEFNLTLFEAGPIHIAVSATGHSRHGFKQYLVEICEAVGLFAADDGRVLGGRLSP
jgi:hypothetical protein